MHTKHPPLLKNLKIKYYPLLYYLHIPDLISHEYVHINTKGVCL